MKKILVTGGCGYIGSHTVIDLVQSGFNVVSVDNYLNSDASVLDQIEKTCGVRIKNYEVDLKDLDALKAVFEQESNIEGVIHFAALKAVNESVEKPLLYYENNVMGQINLLKCQKLYGVKNHIFSSSCSVYGQAEELPVTEDTPILEAASPYARTKQINEQLIHDFVVNTDDYRFVLLRYFNPAGAHEDGHIGESPVNPPQNLIPVITETAIGKIKKMTVFGTDYDTRDGSCVRDFIHVMDLARAHTQALSHLLSGGQDKAVEIFNIGTGDGYSVLEAVQAFERVTGEKLNYDLGPRRPGDIVSVYANNDKARNVLGWKPEHDLESILLTAWDWEKKRS